MNGSLRYGLSDDLTLEGTRRSDQGPDPGGRRRDLACRGAWRAQHRLVDQQTGRGAMPSPVTSPRSWRPPLGRVPASLAGIQLQSLGDVGIRRISRSCRRQRRLRAARHPECQHRAPARSLRDGRHGLYLSAIDNAGHRPDAARTGLWWAEQRPTELLTLGYSVPVAGRFAVHASAFKDMIDSRNYGLSVGVSIQLGHSTSVLGRYVAR